jgi:hypothetical protein
MLQLANRPQGRSLLTLSYIALLALSTSAAYSQTPPSLNGVSVGASQNTKGSALRQSVQVKVENLDALMSAAAVANTKPVLFLNGQEMKGLFGVEEYPGMLVFQLQRTTDNQDAWKPILTRPGLTPVSLVLSVGLPGGNPVPTQWIDFQLTVLHPGWFVAWGILFLVALGFFLYAAKKSSMLRESGPIPAGSEAALSLGRCQMAWWFFIILAAYLFLFMVTWDFDTITAGTLGLMGIAAGTAMAGATVDTSKNSSMAAEKAQLQTEAASVPPPTAARASQIATRIAELDKQLNTPLHTTWYDDLLSDANGLSFHRFQMFVWTIVLGVIFVISTYTDLLMPNFSATLLGLMGISAGTYVGFKFPEQKN